MPALSNRHQHPTYQPAPDTGTREPLATLNPHRSQADVTVADLYPNNLGPERAEILFDGHATGAQRAARTNA